MRIQTGLVVTLQSINLLSSHCVLFNNSSLTLTYVHDPSNHRNLLLGAKYSRLTVYISSTLASICFGFSIFCYICFYA